MWRSDGTSEGTIDLDFIGNYFDPRSITVFNNELYFLRWESIFEGGLSKTNETPQGTQLIFPIATDYYSDVRLISEKNNLYFLLNEADEYGYDEYDTTVWKSDGTETGTTRLSGIGNGYISNLLEINSQLFIVRSDELWSLDISSPPITNLMENSDFETGDTSS